MSVDDDNSFEDDDNYFETKRFKKRSNWVVAIVVLLTLGLLALPFVWAFTGAF